MTCVRVALPDHARPVGGPRRCRRPSTPGTRLGVSSRASRRRSTAPRSRSCGSCSGSSACSWWCARSRTAGSSRCTPGRPRHFTYAGLRLGGAAAGAGAYVLARRDDRRRRGLLVALGWHYRAALAVFLVAFVWLELIEVTTYLNHYWFVTLFGHRAPRRAGRVRGGRSTRAAGRRRRPVPLGAVWLRARARSRSSTCSPASPSSTPTGSLHGHPAAHLAPGALRPRDRRPVARRGVGRARR